MKHRGRGSLGISAISMLGGSTAARAQDPAVPAQPAASSPITTFFVIAVPLVFIGLLVVMVRRSSRMLPTFDRSLVLAEESVRLAKEQLALQAETNRLLAQLLEAQRRS
jgi:hypothetical protein